MNAGDLETQKLGLELIVSTNVALVWRIVDPCAELLRLEFSWHRAARTRASYNDTRRTSQIVMKMIMDSSSLSLGGAVLFGVASMPNFPPPLIKSYYLFALDKLHYPASTISNMRFQ
jgi:hypothetical protein